MLADTSRATPTQQRFRELLGGRVETWVRPHARRRDGGVDRYVWFDPVGIQDWTPLVTVRRGGSFEINACGRHWSLTIYAPGCYRLANWLNSVLTARQERRTARA